MNKLTIKSGCVEAQFKRGRDRMKTLENTQSKTLECPTASETSVAQSTDAGCRKDAVVASPQLSTPTAIVA